MIKELAKIALLGTDRADISDKTKAILEAQGIDLEGDATQILLEAAAIYSQKEKAGFALKKFKGEIPEPADDRDEYACSDNSAHHLQQILQGKFRRALAEFIEYLTKKNRQLPPEMLPDIITSRIAAGDNWSSLRKIIGKRGEWLMRQNPSWHKILPIENPELWAVGNREERISVLKYLRSKLPDLATEMLGESWNKEIAKDKVAFLEVLADSTTANDEAFLENCLDDKSKEVRLNAAALLSRIPSSRLVQRISHRLENLVFFENGNLIVQLPEEPDSEGTRDGLFGKMKVAQQGLRTAWLAQIIAFLPPSVWEEKFDMTPLEILEVFLNTDFAQVLLAATLSSTSSSPDAKWAEAFLRFGLKKSGILALPEEDTKGLMQLISVQQYNKVLEDYLPKHSVVANNSPLFALISASSHRLTGENTKTIILQYQQMISSSSSFSSYFSQKELLKVLAYQCDFSVIEELKKGWDMNSQLWRTWADEVEIFVRVLQFRKVMWEGLQV
ncbi:MAG: hypothetical protein ACI85O_000424 [Saprospiraceae bacterium]|jgi:hypothetical protein